jgi:hypothetical protein
MRENKSVTLAMDGKRNSRVTAVITYEWEESTSVTEGMNGRKRRE